MRADPAPVQQQSQAPAPGGMPPLRAACYMLASLLLALTQGLFMNLISANLPQIQGALGATTSEATWLIAAYMAPNVSLSIMLVKVRAQFGLRNFAELGIAAFVGVSALHLLANDLQSAILVRFLGGVAAAPLSTLAFLYMLEPFAPARKLTVGLSLSLTNTALGLPLARLIGPPLLEIGQWHGLYLAEMAMALLSFAAVYLLPLAPPPRAKVIGRLDIASFLLIFTGFGLTAVVLAMGRVYWWLEAPWLGVLLAAGIAAVAAAAAIELNRTNPLVDVRWLTSREIIHVTGVLLLCRIVLVEPTGAVGFFQVLGLSYEQTGTLYAVTIAATVAGGLACAAVMKPGREPWIHAVALLLLIAGALMDSRATNLTRPEEMYASQALIAAAGALFLPPAMARGLMSALKRGPAFILNFIVIILTTQVMGGLLGSALFGSIVTLREKFHSNLLVEHVALTDPLVVQRLAQLQAVYGRVLTDRAQVEAQGLALLSQQATREANVLAYNDMFLLVAAIAAVALAALLVHMAVLALGRRAAAPAPAAS
ncbi:MFS transporter [Arenibaculum pallidiluteum]|uniref:MFS transporter n=1 Tax=Arenibaculum pallidiluteum TaxID=2812559 RepID=UPI002E2D4731|nr:MFS transporter [Arenibaculum pallidiluteum]